MFFRGFSRRQMVGLERKGKWLGEFGRVAQKASRNSMKRSYEQTKYAVSQTSSKREDKLSDRRVNDEL